MLHKLFFPFQDLFQDHIRIYVSCLFSLFQLEQFLSYFLCFMALLFFKYIG